MPARPWSDHRDTALPAGHCPGGYRGPGSLPKYGEGAPQALFRGLSDRICELPLAQGVVRAEQSESDRRVRQKRRDHVGKFRTGAPWWRNGRLDAQLLDTSRTLRRPHRTVRGLLSGPRGPWSIGERPRFSVVEDTEPTCGRELCGPGKSRPVTPLRGPPANAEGKQ